MKQYDRDATPGKMVGVFITGIVIGTVATFLLCPQSGRESRGQIRDYVRRKGEDLSDFQDRTVETYQDIVSGTRRELKDIQEGIKEAVHAGMEEFRKELNDIKSKV